MKIEFKNNKVIVHKEKQDKKIYNDSQLLYHIKLKLIDMGYDMIKKLAYKDGHLVSDTMYYLRERKNKFYIYDPEHSIRFAYQDYNNGKLILERSE